MDIDRRVTSWNTGATRVLQFEETDIIGRLGDIIFVPEDREAAEPEKERQAKLAQQEAELAARRAELMKRPEGMAKLKKD